MRFLDTLSLHVCVAGQTAAQKHLWKSTFGKKTEDSDYKMPSYEENGIKSEREGERSFLIFQMFSRKLINYVLHQNGCL